MRRWNLTGISESDAWGRRCTKRTVEPVLIIARLLNLGGMAGYCWTVDLYSERVIARAVIHRRDMHPIVRNFMAERYDIPKEQLVVAPAWR